MEGTLRGARTAVVLVLIVLAGVAAEAATPVPAFPADGVAVAAVADAYGELRDFLRYYESRVGAQYRVAIVDLSDRLDRRGPEYGDDTGAYIDAVVEAWRAELNPATHLTIVLALGNREVLIQPGSAWVRLGYGGRVVGEVTDRSPFGLYARAGDFGRAATELIRFIDADLLRRQRDMERRGEVLTDRLARLDERVGSLRERFTRAAFDIEAIAPLLQGATSELAGAREVLAGGDLERAERLGRDAEGSLSAAESEFAVAGNAHAFRTRQLPIIVTVVFLLLLGIGLLMLRHRSRIWRQQAKSELDRWAEKLDQAGQRLLALESENATLLGWDDLATRFEGDTAPEVRRVAEGLDHLFLSLAAAQKLLETARGESEGTGFLAVSGHRAALARLAGGEVVVRTEDVQERRLFLPDERVLRMSASELLTQMDADYGALSNDLHELERRILGVWADIERGVPALASNETQLAELEAGGGPVAAYRRLVESRREELARVSGASQRDPLGNQAAMADLANRIEGLGTRLKTAREALSVLAEHVGPAAQKGEARIRHLRDREGMRLLEPGFEPDRMLEHVAEQTRLAQAALEAAEEDEAKAAVGEAADSVDELSELVEASVASRAGSKEAINRLTAQRGRLRERAPAARAQLERLTGEHADSALQPALDNAEEAEAALAFATSCLSEATTALTVTEQRYLAGAELVRRADETLRRVEALFDEVDDKERELGVRRAEAEGSLGALEERVRELRALVEGEAPYLSQASYELIDLLGERQAALVAHGGSDRPDWIALAAEAEAVVRVATELRARVLAEESAHAELPGQLDAAREAQEALRRELGTSSDDRPPANETLQSAERLLKTVEETALAERPDWSLLLTELYEVRAQLEEARRLATVDFHEAAQARQTLASAETNVREANVGYGHGIVADLTGSRAALEQARAALAVRQFEEASRLAAQARQEASEAKLGAQRRAAQKAAEEAKRASQWRSQSSGGSSGSRRVSFGSSSRSSSSFSSSRSSGRSSSSSSFGSSSGRSSFGRSSGRSKW